MQRLRRSLPLALLALLAPRVAAQQVDLVFSPAQSIVQVGDTVEVQLVAFASGVSPVSYAAIDALLDWDPQHLLLVGVDDSLAAQPWLVSSFLLDPDGINASLADGDALYTALCQPGTPAVAPPAGAVVTTFQFVALLETPNTPITLTPALGVYGQTAVYDYDTPGATLTGDISSSGLVRIVPEPTAYCFGEPADCPCGNPGGAGEGCRNSTGAGGVLAASGSTSVAADDLVLTASQLPASQFGLFIVGGGQNDLPFGDGLRCVAPGPTGLNRFNPPQPSSPGGTLTRGPGLVAYSQVSFPLVGHLAAGGTYHFQAWYRDPVGSPCGSGFNLTNGLEVTFTP